MPSVCHTIGTVVLADSLCPIRYSSPLSQPAPLGQCFRPLDSVRLVVVLCIQILKKKKPHSWSFLACQATSAGSHVHKRCTVSRLVLVDAFTGLMRATGDIQPVVSFSFLPYVACVTPALVPRAAPRFSPVALTLLMLMLLSHSWRDPLPAQVQAGPHTVALATSRTHHDHSLSIQATARTGRNGRVESPRYVTMPD